MMFMNKVTMLILSCDAFSDLWEGHIQLLEKNWHDRNMKTYIVTDRETDRKFSNVEIIAAVDQPEWSDRLKYALKFVDTEYVFVTLDDYFLIEPVDNQKMLKIIRMMDKERFDYVRLFKRPKCATREKIPEYPGLNRIDTNEVYSVNLYSGIWKKDFLAKTTNQSLSAWKYEVRLARVAREYNAHCVVSHNREFVILDVVRKGKLLHKSAKYFKKHPGIYRGHREVNTWSYEIKLGIRTFGARHAPKFVVNAARNFMIRRGHHYFSQDA